MNVLSYEAHWSPLGWFAFYTPWHTTRPQAVTDKRGEPIRYPTADKAKIAAADALVAKLNQVEALRFDPAQIKPDPQLHKARSRAGKRAFAERQLREALKEAAE